MVDTVVHAVGLWRRVCLMTSTVDEIGSSKTLETVTRMMLRLVVTVVVVALMTVLAVMRWWWIGMDLVDIVTLGPAVWRLLT